MNIIHPDYSKLAARLAVSNLHKYTSDSFLGVAAKLRYLKDSQGRDAPLMADDVYQIIANNADKIQARIDY
jgi:hypothetical protein